MSPTPSSQTGEELVEIPDLARVAEDELPAVDAVCLRRLHTLDAHKEMESHWRSLKPADLTSMLPVGLSNTTLRMTMSVVR